MDRTDEQIKRNIIDSLYWDNRIDASRVKVEVNEGNVELTGNVPTFMARVAAEEDAEVISGVISVRNKLGVEYEESIPTHTDAELQSNLENAFSWDPNLEATEITISVSDGWVALEGTVDSYWKKIKAEDIASNMAGVLGVTNKLAVVPSEDVVDKAIAEDITAALDRSLNSDIANINLKIEDGVVTLSGTVPSLPAKKAVEEVAAYTAGVADVKDELMIVAP